MSDKIERASVAVSYLYELRELAQGSVGLHRLKADDDLSKRIKATCDAIERDLGIKG